MRRKNNRIKILEDKADAILLSAPEVYTVIGTPLRPSGNVVLIEAGPVLEPNDRNPSVLADIANVALGNYTETAIVPVEEGELRISRVHPGFPRPFDMVARSVGTVYEVSALLDEISMPATFGKYIGLEAPADYDVVNAQLDRALLAITPPTQQ